MRAATLAAQGLEVAVQSEHDQIASLRPLLSELGLDDVVTTVIGCEITMSAQTGSVRYSGGHWNAWPLPLEPLAYRGGAPLAEGQRPRRVIAAMRRRVPEVLIQLNHPRAGRDEGPGHFFSHLGVRGEPFDGTQALTSPSNTSLSEKDPETGVRDLDFDAMELLNGNDYAAYRRNRGDWFSLLLQGEVITATANSDSHVAFEAVASPRNYVRLEADSVQHFDQAAFVEAIRSGKLSGSTGPFLDVSIGEAGPGDTVRGNQHMLQVAVQSAAWAAVQTLRVFVNGALAHSGRIEVGKSLAIPLRVERDAFVTVEVEGHPGPAFEAVAPGHRPFAFSNPIYLDANSDGSWQPPGLARQLPLTIRRPLQSPGP